MNNLITKTEKNILTITINREKSLNALNEETLQELKIIFTSLDNRKNLRGVIMTGSGKKAFVAGADIKEFINLSQKEANSLSQNGHDIFNLIENFPHPVIGAINGFALGGGCELAMACHIRIASNNALFGQPEVNLGLIPGYAGTQRLTQLVGKGKAIELLTTARIISAKEAKRIGLVNDVVSEDDLMPTCYQLLEEISKKSPLTISSIIKCVNDYYKQDVDGYKTEREEFRKCFKTKDFKEGVSAFLEKRKSNFTGK